MGEIRPKECEPRELTKDQLAAAGAGQARAWAPRARRIGSDGYRRAVPTRGESDGGFRLPAVVCRRTNNENCLRCARLHSLADGNNCVLCLQKQSQWKRIHRKKVSEEVRPYNSPLIAL